MSIEIHVCYPCKHKHRLLSGNEAGTKKTTTWLMVMSLMGNLVSLLLIGLKRFAELNAQCLSIN